MHYITVNTLCRTLINILSLIETESSSLIKIRTKFLGVVSKWQNRKDHSVSAFFLVYSIFSKKKTDYCQNKISCHETTIIYTFGQSLFNKNSQIQNLHENSQSVAFFTITALIRYMKKLLNSNWLRAVQFKCNTPVQKV